MNTEVGSPSPQDPSPKDLPDPGIELGSTVLQADSLPAELPGKPIKKDIHMANKYWDGQKFIQVFVTTYGKVQMNFLVNPIY